MFKNIEGKVLFNEDLARYTSWKVGGKCKAIVFPQTMKDITTIISYCKDHNMQYTVIGNGSNVLKSDDYFDGVVINMSKTMTSITIEDEKIIAGGGCKLPKLAFQVAKNGIGNFDFYAGIPGTVGGAVVMNAGSVGKETKDVLLSVTYLNEDGQIVKEPIEKLDLGFRKSKFQHRNTIILSAEFKKEYMDEEDAMRATKEIAERRRRKFPLRVPTAGSTFKSPVGGPYPGKIIEDLGLKGKVQGKAKISERHGNWIENLGGASAKDIEELILYIQRVVQEQTNIDLEVEVIKI